MATRKQQQLSVLIISTSAFTVCFAVWMLFAVIGIPIKAMLMLNETQFGLLAATPVLTGSLIRLPLMLQKAPSKSTSRTSCANLASTAASKPPFTPWNMASPLHLLDPIAVFCTSAMPPPYLQDLYLKIRATGYAHEPPSHPIEKQSQKPAKSCIYPSTPDTDEHIDFDLPLV